MKSLQTVAKETTLLATHFNIVVICMDPQSPNKFIAAKYCFLILGGDTSFFFFIFRVFLLLLLLLLLFNFTFLLIFTKIIIILF